MVDYENIWNDWAREDAKTGILGSSEEDTVDSQRFEVSGKSCADFLKKYINTNAMVLDIGCGIGRIEKYLAPFCKELHALDVSSDMLEIAKERLKNLTNVFLHKGNGRNLRNFPDSFFNFSWSWLVFQHIEKEDAYIYLKEIYRVLKPDGLAWIQVPNYLSEYYSRIFDSEIQKELNNPSLKRSPCRVRMYTPEEILKMLEIIGFSVVELSADTEIVVLFSKESKNG